jgi:ferric-dicitrate binding protein FerR (iron transport regulator)
MGEAVNRGWDHIPLSLLLDHVAGQLSPDDEAQVQFHLDSGCKECLKELAFWRRVSQALDAQPWPAPPRSEHVKAVRAFRKQLAFRPAQPRRPNWGWLAAAAAGMAMVIIVMLALPRGEIAYAASLQDISGEVEIHLRPDGEWTAVSKPGAFPQGAEIRTGESGQATLVFPDQSQTIMGAMTSLKVDGIRHAHAQWQIEISQSRGKAQYLVGAGKSAYRIRTSAGEIATTGGQFNVGANQDGSVQVDVEEGAATLASPAGIAQIAAGESATFPPGASLPVLSTADYSTTAGPSALNTAPPTRSKPTDTPGSQENNGQNNNTGEEGEDPG